MKVDDLKLFENWSGIKTIWKKIRVLKFIWKLKSWKLNLKIGILKNYLKMKVLKIKSWRIIWECHFLKIKFEN